MKTRLLGYASALKWAWESQLDISIIARQVHRYLVFNVWRGSKAVRVRVRVRVLVVVS